MANQFLKGLNGTISDHCPIFLEVSNQDWGPRSFKIFNSWIFHLSFKPFVKEKWKGYNVKGWVSFMLKEKLKLLKGNLREWNKFVCHMDNKIEEKTREI